MSDFTHLQVAASPQKLGLEHLQRGQTAFNWRGGLEGRAVPVDRSTKPKDALRVNLPSNIGRSRTTADIDKTARIMGRTNTARSQ